MPDCYTMTLDITVLDENRMSETVRERAGKDAGAIVNVRSALHWMYSKGIEELATSVDGVCFIELPR